MTDHKASFADKVSAVEYYGDRVELPWVKKKEEQVNKQEIIESAKTLIRELNMALVYAEHIERKEFLKLKRNLEKMIEVLGE